IALIQLVLPNARIIDARRDAMDCCFSNFKQLYAHGHTFAYDLEGSVRRILDHCGLPFEEACVEFHRTERRVHTASAEQVRRPINRDGVDQWKPYEPWLGPLKAALGPLAR
ncbi:MAG: sulfotransferase, partial [Gammaproteobacteria bacterium]